LCWCSAESAVDLVTGGSGVTHRVPRAVGSRGGQSINVVAGSITQTRSALGDIATKRDHDRAPVHAHLYGDSLAGLGAWADVLV
jgi:hypothetical protein